MIAKTLSYLEALILVACLLLATSRPAHAYLDPGSGSYGLQVAVAGIFGALFSLKLYWGRITATVHRVFVKPFFARSADRRRTDH